MNQDQKKAESRREFLKTAGKFAVYAPPALMIMSNANANDIYASCDNLSTCSTQTETNNTGSSGGGGWLQELANKMHL
jgi:hypothetical protein